MPVKSRQHARRREFRIDINQLLFLRAALIARARGRKGVQGCAAPSCFAVAKILCRCTDLQQKANPELIDIDQIRFNHSLEWQAKIGKNKNGFLFQRNKGSK